MHSTGHRFWALEDLLFFHSSDAWIVGSNPTRCVDVCFSLCCYSVVQCRPELCGSPVPLVVRTYEPMSEPRKLKMEPIDL